MTNANDHDPLAGPQQTPRLPKSGRSKAWELLLQIAPELQSIQPRSVNEPRPPSPVGRAFFLQLVATLTDPVMRSIIVAIVLDMVDDRVKELIAAYITEDDQWASLDGSTKPRE